MPFGTLRLWTIPLKKQYLPAQTISKNSMADEKIIFSMTGVNKIYPPQKQVLKNIYLSFFY